MSAKVMINLTGMVSGAIFNEKYKADFFAKYTLLK